MYRVERCFAEMDFSFPVEEMPRCTEIKDTAQNKYEKVVTVSVSVTGLL